MTKDPKLSRKASVEVVVQDTPADVRDVSISSFRKSNDAISLRIRSGNRYGLLDRKIFNAMISHAQASKPGENAPLKTPTSHQYYWMRLSDLARDASYDSNDVKQLKAHLENLQSIRLVAENDRQWTSESLISSVTLSNSTGLRSKNGDTWLGYAFPPEVYTQIVAPSTYTRLSLIQQGKFRSTSALVLWELCRRYESSPTHLTSAEPYAKRFYEFTGVPLTSPVQEYKYFKRDVLRPAIAEVNAVSNFDVDLIEHKAGRTVSKLQFRVNQKKQPNLVFPPEPVLDMNLLARVRALGLSENRAEDLLAMYGPDQVSRAMDDLHARESQPGAQPVRSRAAYFLMILRNLDKTLHEHHVQDSVSASAISAPRRTKPTCAPQSTAQQRSLLDGTDFPTLDAQQQSILMEEFLSQAKTKQSPAYAALRKSPTLDNPMFRAAFAHWYAQREQIED